VDWLWLGLGILGCVVAAALCAGLAFHLRILQKYIPVITRIFQEKPLFVIPIGQPVAGAEDVSLHSDDGLTLRGCYLRTSKPRKGVILFGLEFGSNRWACVPYCEFLVDSGYDVFALETRGQGDSLAQAGYEPLQWVTDFELADFRTALAYLKQRSDRPAQGVGLFGLSKGGSAGLIVGAEDPFVRCFVTDGAFATMGTMLPYMRHFINIYAPSPLLAKVIPTWYYRLAGRIGIRRVSRARGCRYPDLEKYVAGLAPRPWLMIHGGADNYIKPDMARSLFQRARLPKEFWLVDKAKHNQAMQLAEAEYKRRVLAFFDQHLGDSGRESAAGPHRNGPPRRDPTPVAGKVCDERGA
jgi:alpha-beta hydrolase superfamily lysophospholipase